MQLSVTLWLACNISAWFCIAVGNYGIALVNAFLAFALMLLATDLEEINAS
jgi:small neutral amino acid transporter SnatA (MarC family)